MKIGLFGGTFDPIHIGHLIAARLALEALQLDRVIFIPSGIPPHKIGNEITPADDRLRMVQLAIEQEPNFQISTWELEKKGPSYTIETIEYFLTKYIDDEIYFIMGADMLDDLPNWHHADRILKLVRLIGMTRPGFDLNHCKKTLRAALPNSDQRIYYVEMPGLEISSTWLRERLKHRQTVHYLIPEQVISFIEENGLYDGRQDS